LQISNREELTSRGIRTDRKLILDSLESALREVSPFSLLEKKVSFRNGMLKVLSNPVRYSIAKADQVLVVGAGKASGYLALSIEKILGDQTITCGCVNVLKGTANYFHTKKIEINEATHPTPSEGGVSGARKIVRLVKSASERSIVICLISGGGSSLLPLPPPEVPLRDKVRTTELLLRSGASIDELNCVRKHISLVKGGQLVKQASNSPQFLSLIISDVVGDALGSIASGPTAPDPTTFRDAISVLQKYDLLEKVPKSVRVYIKLGIRGKRAETPKPGDRIFNRVTNCIIARNKDACQAAVQTLENRLHSPCYYLGSSWQGDADELARNLSGIFCSGFEKPIPSRKPFSIVWGGEATVKVRGNGEGGRNQQEALVCLERLSECSDRHVTAAFFGTDGIDGNTNCAGAIIDQESSEMAKSKKLEPGSYLRNNDSNGFFKATKSNLIRTGPTGTNVNDIGIAIIRRK
jgi:glycerate 2-kinase